jgi:hypothetical protein
MVKKYVLVGLAVTALAVAQMSSLSADWKSKAARKAVGKTAQNGLEHAVEDAVKDAAFDTAMDAAIPDRSDIARKRGDEVADEVRDAADRVDRDRDLGDAAKVGSSAANGIEAAMDAADFAHGIDTAMDVADTAKKAKKINKVRKVIR